MKYSLLISIFFTLTFLSAFSQVTNTNISNGIAFDGEPFLAINPVNQQNLVASWMSLSFSGGHLAIAIKTRASFNGGNTWSTGIYLPHFGTGYTSADVSMAFDKNGLLYISYIDSHQSPDSGGVYVARSFDGGLTWDTPDKAFDAYDVPNKFPVDRPWLVVDKSNSSNAGTLYITTKPAPWIAPPNRNYYKVSTDSGHTWSPIANVDGGNHLVGNLIAAPMAAPNVTSGGKFCAVYPSYVASQNIYPAFYCAQSHDKGQTFSYTTVLTGVPAASDTNYKGGYSLTANFADSNQLAFLFTDATNGDDDIMALHSNDGGQTWSNKVRVNDDTLANGKAQDMVWTTYNEQGKLLVTWRDRRNAPNNGFWNVGYDFYYATSSDNGQTFSANQKLSSQFIPFDSIISQNGNDFMTCVYHTDTVYTLWGDTRTGKMNIFFAKTIAGSNTNVGFAELENNGEEFSVFPNPGKDEFTISGLSFTAQLQIPFQVFDEAGNKIYSGVFSKETDKLKSANWQSGVYFLKIGEAVKRLIKE